MPLSVDQWTLMAKYDTPESLIVVLKGLFELWVNILIGGREGKGGLEWLGGANP